LTAPPLAVDRLDVVRLCPLCDADAEGALCSVHRVPTVSRDFFSAAHAPCSLGMVIGGRFRLDDRLGEGANGTVFRATQLALDRSVAVKVLKKARLGSRTALKRFYLEAEALVRLQQSSIVQLIEFGVDDTTQSPYLVTELVEGTSLDALLTREGALSKPRAVRLLLQLVNALSVAHEAGIVHRDLKPSNAIVMPLGLGDEHLKVLDFGTAKMLDDGGLAFTAPGSVLGTPMYMSPEQSKGRDASGPSDVYAVGCMLFELVTGMRPFAGETLAELLTNKLAGPPPLPAAFEGSAPADEALRALVVRMLDVKPERRPDVRELRAAFTAMLDDPAWVETRATIVDRPRTPRRDPFVKAAGEKKPAHDRALLAMSTMAPLDEASRATIRERVLETPAPAVTRPSAFRERRVTLAAGAIAIVVLSTALTVLLGTSTRPLSESTTQTALPIAKIEPTPSARARAPSVTHAKIVSHPEGADVFIGDALKGRTPLDLELSVEGGATSLRIVKAGYEAVTRTVEGVPDRSLRIEVWLVENAPAGTKTLAPASEHKKRNIDAW
jgi:serine/threonine-protein kinase